jgi:hypothetical protein
VGKKSFQLFSAFPALVPKQIKRPPLDSWVVSRTCREPRPKERGAATLPTGNNSHTPRHEHTHEETRRRYTSSEFRPAPKNLGKRYVFLLYSTLKEVGPISLRGHLTKNILFI